MEVPFRESLSSREAPEIATEDNIQPFPGAGTTPLDLDLAPHPGGTASIHTPSFTSAPTHGSTSTTTQNFTLVHTPGMPELSPVSGLNSALADRGLDTRRDSYRPVGNLPAFYEDDHEGALGFRPINRMPSPVPSHKSKNSRLSQR